MALTSAALVLTSVLAAGLAPLPTGSVGAELRGPVPLSGARSWAATGSSVAWQADSVPHGFPGLFYPSLASDPLDNYTLLFGGCTGVLCPSGDTNATWAFSDGQWTRLNVSPSPPPRGEAQMAWDPADQMVLLFGGAGCLNPPACTVNGRLNDTWGFAHGHWTEIATTGSVPATEEGGLAYDPSSQQMVLFGGYSCFSGCTTWTYYGGTWTALNLTTSPPYRYGEGFAEDDADNGALLFGGVSSSGNYLSDTWLYSSGAWTPKYGGSSPAQRVDPMMGWDPAQDQVVLFGGQYVTLSNFPGVTYGDTWTFAHGGWSAGSGSGSAPGARSEAGGAEDPASGVFVMTGGCGPAGCPYSDSWGWGTMNAVTVASPQASLVNVTLLGKVGPLNRTVNVQGGHYAINLTANSGYDIANVTARGAITVRGALATPSAWNGSVQVAGSGTIWVNITSAPAPIGPEKSQPSSVGGLPEMTLVIIVAVIAAAAVAAVVAVLLRRRKPPTDPTAQGTADETPGGSATDPGTSGPDASPPPGAA